MAVSPWFALPMVTIERPDDSRTQPAGRSVSGAPPAGISLLGEE